jgi:tetratricopeptide (TPR) repeat protein
VFHHLAEEGKLFDAEGRWRADVQLSELEVPRGVRLVIGRRLERVGEECRRVLTTAAVIGRAFTFELLEALGEADTDTLLDAVDEAERAHLITSTADRPEAHFRFGHELIRQTLLSGFSSPRRQRLHLRVAESMERAYAGATEDHAADLAHHLCQAGTVADPTKTVRYLTLAGERAIEAVAFEEALRHFDNALSLEPPGDVAGRADLLFKRGLALRSLGRWNEALADWQQALASYEELRDAEALGRISSDITQQLGWDTRFLEALEISRRGLMALGERVSADRCRLLAAAGMILSLAGSYAAADGMIGQALALAEELGDQRLLGEALMAKTVRHWAYVQPRECVDTGLRAAEISRSVGSLWDLASILAFVQHSQLRLGHLNEVAETGAELEPLAARLGHLGAAFLASRTSSEREFILMADLDTHEKSAKSDLEFTRNAGLPWISTCYAALGLNHFLRGRWEQSRELWQEAARLEPPGFVAGLDSSLLPLVNAHAGDNDAAIALLNQRRANLPRPGQPTTAGPLATLTRAIEALAVLGERNEPANLYPQVLDAIERGVLVFPTDFRLLPTVAGIAAAAGGQWEKAEEHYRTALRQAHELPNKIEQPEVRRWYARMLIDRDGPGDRDKARQLLTEAVAMYRKIGMPKHVEMAEGMLGEV